MALELCSRTASGPHQARHVRQADDYVLGRQDCRAATAGQTIVIEAIRELAGQAVDMLAGRDQLCTNRRRGLGEPRAHLQKEADRLMGVLEDLFDVRDQVALVTGGASGLGYAFASILADCGATVIVADWNGERLEKELRGLSSRGRVAGYPLDVTDARGARACVDSIAAEYKSIDIAFANAGVARGRPPLLPEGWLDDMSMTDYNA